jgi:hypothetical protein
VFLSEAAEGLTPETIWPAEEVGTNDSAKKQLLEMFGGKNVFDTPKPVGLIKRVFTIGSAPGDLVLDSFAGSGTSGHACLELNTEEKGPARRFVLVQQANEGGSARDLNLARDVVRERIIRAGRTETPVAFTYARVGKPLLGEHRDWGDKLPTWLELGRYVFYTETSQELDSKGSDEGSGFLGEYGGTSYYLLYSARAKGDRALDRTFLQVLRKDRHKRKVVYCEKIWVYREDLASLRPQIGEVRPMLLPFQVK